MYTFLMHISIRMKDHANKHIFNLCYY